MHHMYHHIWQGPHRKVYITGPVSALLSIYIYQMFRASHIVKQSKPAEEAETTVHVTGVELGNTVAVPAVVRAYGIV